MSVFPYGVSVDMHETEAFKYSQAEQDDEHEAPQEEESCSEEEMFPCGSQRVMCITFLCVCGLWGALSASLTPVSQQLERREIEAKCTELAIGWA